MRPNTIAYFETIYLATFGLGILQIAISWDRALQIASPAFILTVQVFTFGVLGGLMLLVSRRRSKVAMWVLIALFALGVPFFFKQVAEGHPMGNGWISALQVIGQLAALSLLFTPSARGWFNREAGKA